MTRYQFNTLLKITEKISFQFDDVKNNVIDNNDGLMHYYYNTTNAKLHNLFEFKTMTGNIVAACMK